MAVVTEEQVAYVTLWWLAHLGWKWPNLTRFAP
jgi:hypothetical protein